MDTTSILAALTKKDRIVWICNYPFYCPFPLMEFGLWHYSEENPSFPQNGQSRSVDGNRWQFRG
jgi:hypothetical protein